MSTKVERTVEEIHREYSSLCIKAGAIQYQVKILKDDLALLNDQMKELNFEAAAVNAKAKEVEKKDE